MTQAQQGQVTNPPGITWRCRAVPTVWLGGAALPMVTLIARAAPVVRMDGRALAHGD